MEVNFCIEQHNFKSHLLMFMTEESIDTLRGILDQFLDGV